MMPMMLMTTMVMCILISASASCSFYSYLPHLFAPASSSLYYSIEKTFHGILQPPRLTQCTVSCRRVSGGSTSHLPQPSATNTHHQLQWQGNRTPPQPPSSCSSIKHMLIVSPLWSSSSSSPPLHLVLPHLNHLHLLSIDVLQYVREQRHYQ